MQSALKFVKLVIGRLTLYQAEKVADMLWWVNLDVQLFETRFVLEVGLSVQVLRLDVSQATGVAWLNQYQVGGEVLVLADLHDLAYPQIFPGVQHKIAVFFLKSQHLPRILNVVSLVSL